MIRQLDMGLEGKLVRNPEILKVTSGNMAKQLKMSQETQVTIWAKKTKEVAVKQLVIKELQVEKTRIKG